MSNLILGANSNFGKLLKTKLPGTYLARQDFNLLTPEFAQFASVDVDNVIFLTKSNATTFAQVGKSCDTVFTLLDTIKYNTAWIFTSRLGTFGGSKNNEHVYYASEKMLLNFISFKKNHANYNIKIIHPGHMGTVEEYTNMVNNFVQLIDNPPDKNFIWCLAKKSYIYY
jgi:hypothetical protein